MCKKKHAGYILWNKTRIDPICDPEPVNTLSRRNPHLKFATTFGDKRDNVTVLGLQNYELAKQVVEHAALYLCTTRETFGIGTVEAMASGVPVVGWAWGGQREIVTNGVHGYLAQPGNYDELEYGIQLCLDHRAEMSVACRTLVEDRFTWRKTIKQYAKLYASVVAKKPAHPKVSVIITNYKLEHYLREAVQSVLTQENFPHDQLEIIVVNDDSPTWNLDWCDEPEKIGYGIIKVIHNARNRYLAGSLNVGIEASTGDYIVNLDADNLLGPRALATLATALDNDKSLDIVYGAMQLYATGQIGGWPGEFDYRQQITHHNQIPSTCMYRRRVWERSGGYRERCRTAEDADFWCRVTSLGFKPKRVTDAVTLIYRDRDDSMSRVERDWGWHNWYTWNRYPKLTPFVAPAKTDREINVPTYEPVKISVVIPVGPGHERLVIDAVDSLVAQTFLNWECIVVNDTGAPLPWIHPFVKVANLAIDKPVANRVSRARNTGIALAQAKYFLLLDADDYLQPSALQQMYNAMTRAEEGTAYAYTDWYTAETKERHSTPNYSCTGILDKFSHAVTCLYSKEAWTKVSGFDENLEGWEDWDFVIALNAAGYCGIRVPYPLFQYRVNGGKRREELYAKLEPLKKEMYNKWEAYITGEKKMPCGCQNKNVIPTRLASDGSIMPEPGGDMVQLEYVGEMLGPLNYQGKVTGNKYLFGTEPEHSVKYVFREDVPAMLSIDGFRYYDESNNEPVLEALGPPQREAEAELVNA